MSLSIEFSRYLHSRLDAPLHEYRFEDDLADDMREMWVKNLPWNAKVCLGALFVLLIYCLIPEVTSSSPSVQVTARKTLQVHGGGY